MFSFLGYLVDLPNCSISFPKAIRNIKTHEAHGHHASRSLHPGIRNYIHVYIN